jgi:hypothetical protein
VKKKPLHKRIWFNDKRRDVSAFIPAVGNLARILVTKRANVSAPKNKKNAPAGESGNQRPKRRREKVIV